MERTQMKTDNTQYHTATLAGGCFWCTTSAFHDVSGIIHLESGYIGGHVENPTYEQVCSGTTGHYEAVQITYDPGLISYTRLLHLFFRQIDPTDSAGSFVDRGPQYRSAVFYHTDRQRQVALKIIETINNSGLFSRPVATKVLPADIFYPAESYHQDYHSKNPIRYRYYRAASGRDIFIEQNRADYNRIFDKKIKV
jgi:peptide methionine sulfoxide reductase msrA/msrB